MCSDKKVSKRTSSRQSFHVHHLIINIVSNIARECRCAVLVLDRVDNNIAELLKNHENPDRIVNSLVKDSAWTSTNNLLLLHRDDYYNVSDDDESVINIVFNDGFRCKNRKSINCVMNIKTGKITDVGSKGVCN